MKTLLLQRGDARIARNSSTRRRGLRFVLRLAAVMLLGAPRLSATDQVVSDAGDNGGPNQLRAKLAALQSSGGGTLTFTTGAATVVLLQGSLPAITTNSTISGGGNITISGNNASRVFVIGGGATLTLQNITIVNGYSSDGDGGAIYNNGTLNVRGCKFFGNETAPNFSGGAILSYGPLNITNSEFGGNKGGNGGAVYPRFPNAITTISGCNFHDNEATNTTGSGWGGALLLWDGADVTISNTTLSNNKARIAGGAIYVTGNSKLTLRKNCLLAENSAYEGGAIQNDGDLTLTDVTVTANHAQQAGGGLRNGATMSLSNAWVTGNHSDLYSGGGIHNYGKAMLTNVVIDGNRSGQSQYGNGGGLFNMGTAILSQVTLSNNISYQHGGAIYNVENTPGAASLTLTNVTVSTNSSAAGGAIYNYASAGLTCVTLFRNSAQSGPGAISQLGTITITNTIVAKGGAGAPNSNVPLGGTFNLSDDDTCGFGSGRDNVTDLLLGPLANNGGFTKTHLPQAGSRAIDYGTGANVPPTDQRGIQRPQGNAVDVGAVEATIPLLENAHPFVQYDGWRGFKSASASGGYYRMSNVTGDTVSYTFTGTSLKWITRKGPNMGKALVTIDGVSKGTYDLYSSTVRWKQQLLFGGLGNARHTVVIHVTGTKNASATGANVALDGFLVGSSTTPLQESVLKVRYGKWRGTKQTAASGDSCRSNGTLGSVARFRFNGTSVKFVTARGPRYGKVDVLIDGVLRSSNLDLYAAMQQWQYGLQYSGLSNANHTIEIRPTHTKNASSSGYGVVVDAFTGWFTALP